MNVFAVNCLASWYDDWTSVFIGVYTTLENAREAYKEHLVDNTRECLWKDLDRKEFWCTPEITEVELDRPCSDYSDSCELKPHNEWAS